MAGPKEVSALLTVEHKLWCQLALSRAGPDNVSNCDGWC